MTRTHWLAATLLAGMLATPAAHAQDVQYVDGADGIRYQVITQTTQRPINETRYEPRTTYQERHTTDFQEVQRTYQVPVTEQQWVPGYQRTLNIFAPPVLSYRLLPVTRWETRVETVRVPVTRRDYIPQTQQVPVVTQRMAPEKVVRHIPVGTVGDGTLTANRNDAAGGQQLESDPPREGAVWRGGLEPTRP
ncbi:MAG: hypothetical protein AB7O59_24955 [Pirellulales bacterium]